MLQQVTGQLPIDDELVRMRLVEQVMREKRMLLIGQQARTRAGVSSAYYQEINCLELQCGKVECKGISTNRQHHYITVPELASYRDAIWFLGSTDGSVEFQPTSLGGYNSRHQRFGMYVPRYTIIGNKALIKDPPNGKYVRMIAVLWDPAQGLCGASKDDADYPMDDRDISKLVLLCIQQLLSTKTPSDLINDATNQVVVPQHRRTPDPNEP